MWSTMFFCLSVNQLAFLFKNVKLLSLKNYIKLEDESFYCRKFLDTITTVLTKHCFGIFCRLLKTALLLPTTILFYSFQTTIFSFVSQWKEVRNVKLGIFTRGVEIVSDCQTFWPIFNTVVLLPIYIVYTAQS